MIIDELLISLGFKLDKKSVKDLQTFEQGFKKATTNLLKMTAAAVAGSAALVAFTKVMSESTDELAKSARRIGIEAQELDSLRFAMNLVTGSGTGVNSMLEAFGQNLSQLSRGEGNVLAFNKLGVTLDGTATQLDDITGLFQQAVEGASKLGKMERLEFLGAVGLDKAVLAADDIEAFSKALKEANSLSFISRADTKAAEDFNDDWVRLTRVIREFSVLLSSSLSPFLSEALEGFRAWMLVNKEFLRAELGKVFTTLGKALKIVAGFLGRMASHAVTFVKWTKSIGGLNTALKVTLGVFTLIAAMQFGLMIKNLALAVTTLAVKFGVLNFMAALPVVTISALIGLIILLGDEIATAIRGGRTLFTDLFKQFPNFAKFVEDATRDIIIHWDKLTKFLSDPFDSANAKEYFDFLGKVGAEAFDALKGLLRDFLGVDLDSSAWTAYFDSIADSFKGIIDPIEDALERIGFLAKDVKIEPFTGELVNLSNNVLSEGGLGGFSALNAINTPLPAPAAATGASSTINMNVDFKGFSNATADDKRVQKKFVELNEQAYKQALRNIESGNAK